MSIIYIDIETAPTQEKGAKEEILATIKPPANYSKPETIAKWMEENAESQAEESYRKTALDGTHGQIVCIGMAIDNAAPVVFHNSKDWHKEAEVIQSAFDWLDSQVETLSTGYKLTHPDNVFVGHNIIDFDLPFIWKRCVINGIKPPSQIPFKARPWSESIYDTMREWSGTHSRISMDKLAKALKVGGKGDMDGSMVWDYIQAGKLKEVRDYCASDIELVRKIHKRMTFGD